MLTFLSQARKAIHPTKPRPSLQPGTILILLAGRFRGKRVILLKHLPQGALLITGPFKINGVPLRRVNARYVIATKSKVDLNGIDSKTLEKVAEDGYFTRDKATQKKNTEEAFFKQGEKPEVFRFTRDNKGGALTDHEQKKKVASGRATDQKNVDKALLSNIKKEKMLASYLATNFSLRTGDKPHEMVF